MKQRKLSTGKGISDLPDELLVCILSFLDPDEAARASVLSRRWKYLWYFTFGCLDFDPQDTTTLETAMRRKKFIRWASLYFQISPVSVNWISMWRWRWGWRSALIDLVLKCCSSEDICG